MNPLIYLQKTPTLQVLLPLLLASFATLFISAPTPALARDAVPFNGTVSGYVESQSGTECEPSTHVINFGHANHLGAFTGTAEFSPRPCDPDPDLCENDIPYTGSFDWFASNGDEIYGTFEGYLCPTETPGVYDNHETAEITGGTGRFANATGHFELGATRFHNDTALLCPPMARGGRFSSSRTIKGFVAGHSLQPPKSERGPQIKAAAFSQ
jgi:hypothetical protein